MTIAVAVKYPLGELNRLLPPGVTVPEAVILAADSRISQKTTNGHKPWINNGAKLFQLGKDVAAVYAGASEIGELCFAQLRNQLISRKELSNRRIIITAHNKQIAEEVFQGTFDSYIAATRGNPEQFPLYIMLGSCNTRGRAELYQFSYDSRFKAKPIAGLNTIAWPKTKTMFETLFTEELHKKVEEEISLRNRHPKIPMAAMLPMPIQPQHLGLIITALLKKTIESQADATIGGLIQCAVITTEGFKLEENAYSTNPTNEGGWTTATASPGELRTVSEKFGFNKLND